MAGPLPIGDPAPADGSLPAQSSIGASERTLHAYVHIPFCKVRCGYCDFNTYTASELDGAKQSDYTDIVIAEIKLSAQVIADAGLPNRKLSTVFFGGGTPTLLPAADLVKILAALRDAFEITPGAEVTTEANPDTVNAEYLRELRDGGFNRVSFGMQSAVTSVLATLERTHNPANVAVGVAAAKDLGLRTSVDLIYGAPGESLDEWRQSVLAAIQMQPDHISAYALIVEDGTKLARQIKSGQLEEPDEDLQADKYELADKSLGDAGFGFDEAAFDGGFEDGGFVAFEVGFDALEVGDGFVEAGELFFDFGDSLSLHMNGRNRNQQLPQNGLTDVGLSTTDCLVNQVAPFEPQKPEKKF